MTAYRPNIIIDIKWTGKNDNRPYTHQAKIYIENIIGCTVYFNKYYKKYVNDHDNNEIDSNKSSGIVKRIFMFK